MPRALRSLLVLVVCSVAVAAGGAESSTTSPPPDAKQTATLEALDRIFARFDALVARDDDAAHCTAEQSVLDGLKKRREALRSVYDSAKYDELRVDLNLEYQRMAAWLAAPGPATSKNKHP